MTQLEALQIIARRDNGVITPAAVIEEARDKNSVLHGAFTWDDTEAAAKWRVYEAQKLIRRFYVKSNDDDGNTVSRPVFVNLSVDRGGKAEANPYRLVDDVAKSESLVDIAVNDALEQLDALKERYEYLKSLKGVWREVDAVKAKVKAKREGRK